MPVFRSTALQLAQNHCPHAIDHYESGVPYDRSVFATGTAAHAFLEAIARGESLDDTERRLLEFGRVFEGDHEPPLPPEAVISGRVLAAEWAAEHPTPDGAVAEETLCVDRDGNLVNPLSDAAYYKAAIDLRYVLDVVDEEQAYRVAVSRDYKSSWAATEATLDTLQMKGQAYLLSRMYPDADVIRIEVANLRTRRIFARDIVMSEGGRETMEEYRKLIDAYIVQAGQSPRPARAGSGCNGCPWLMSCSSARAILRGGVMDLEPGADPRQAVALRLSVVEAMRNELLEVAKPMASEEPIQLPGGGYVGYKAQSERVVSAGAAASIADLWLGGHELRDRMRDVVAGLVTALRPGVSSVDNLVNKLVPAVRGDAGYKERREMIAASLTDTRTSTRFGVHHE